MSLINDALKRAQSAQQDTPSNMKPLAPMTPAAPLPPPTPRKPAKPMREESGFKRMLPVLIILLIVAAVFFIAMSTARRSAKTIIAKPAITPAQQVETAAVPEPILPVAVTPAPETFVLEHEPIGPAAIASKAAATPKPTRIQGISNDPVHPWAIISGKTVFLGDFVDGMRVTVISRNGITLVGNGQTNRLLVGQK